MTVTVANVDINSDTFLSWSNKTSQLANAMSTKVVTVGGSSYSTTGNAHIIGSMQANAFYATTGLFGGSIASGNSLIIQSNAIFNSNAVLSNTSTYTIFGSTDNIRINSGNTTHRFISVNSSNNTPYYEQVISVGTTGSNVATGNAIISGTFGANTLHAEKIGGGNNTVLGTANVFTNASFTNSVHFSSNTFLGSYGEATTLYVNTLKGGTDASPGLLTISTTANLTSNVMFSGQRVTISSNLAANGVYVKSLYGGNVTSLAALSIPTAVNLSNTATFSGRVNLGNFQDAYISSSGTSADYDGKVLSFYANGQFKPISITFGDISGLPTVTPANNDMLVYNESTSEWNATRVLNVSQISIDADGSGSNIDADQLDGQEGSYYSGLASSAYTNAYNQAVTLSGTAYTNAIARAAEYASAANTLSKLITVDGVGSGLDADLLDGVQLSTIRTEITGNSATAYTNATSYAATIAGTAYSNATSYAATIAGTAYSNAVSTAASDATSKAATAYTNATSYAASIAATAYTNAVSQATTIAGTAYANAIARAAEYSSAANTLSKLLTVDGATSGLDADLLDGVQLSTIRTEISSNASTAYTNAYNQAVSLSSTAYTNAYNQAVSAYTNAYNQAVSLSSTAYTNAVSYVATNSLNAANSTNSKSINGNSYNITQYTINQSVGTSNSPTFSALTIGQSQTAINLSATGSGYIGGTSGDAASSTSSNVKLSSSYGIGFSPSISGQTVPQWENALWMDVRSGDFSARGTITAYASDIRLKTNFQKVDSAVDKINSISGYEFDWDIDKCKSLGFQPVQKHEHGFIAQEIQKIIPDAVSIAPFDNDGENGSKSGENYLTVKYEKMVVLLVEAIKELKAEIEQLKGKK